ncbi:MAG TPA: hypothetical protein VEH84_00255 [Alphaproteobacteria bacterium]|nr:hypothetical protein [Alphaproteobacteria bacterium]
MNARPLPAALAPIGAADLVEQLCAVMTALTEAMTTEAEALRQRRRDLLPELERHKRMLAGSYEMLAGGLGRLPPEDPLTPAQRDRLAQAGLAMEHALVDNLSAVRAAKEVNERLIGMLTEAAIGERPVGTGYNAKGNGPAAYGSRKMAVNPMPMTLNQRC